MNDKYVLKENIERLITINEEYSELNTRLQELRHEKQKLEKETSIVMEKLNMSNKTFVLNDNKIQPKKTIQYQSLSLKYVQDSLSGYLDENQVSNIIEILKSNREKKEKLEFKIN